MPRSTCPSSQAKRNFAVTHKIIPTPEELRKLLRYEPDTGKLFWRPRPKSMFKYERDWKRWNTVFFGGEAFTYVDKNGYKSGRIHNKGYLAHRVIWAIVYGDWSDSFIDHVNGDAGDNRISNLRKCTNTQNAYNRGPQKNNKSGFKGVSFNKRRSKWHASIAYNGKTVHLGDFSSKVAAAAAYADASKKYHGEFARLK